MYTKSSLFDIQDTLQKAKRRRNAIIRQNRPMASERAKPRMAYEKSWPFRVGFREQPIIKDPNTTPIPMPESTLKN